MPFIGYDPDDYPEGHSPFCPRDCTHECHDAYDREQEMKHGRTRDTPNS